MQSHKNDTTYKMELISALRPLKLYLPMRKTKLPSADTEDIFRKSKKQ